MSFPRLSRTSLALLATSAGLCLIIAAQLHSLKTVTGIDASMLGEPAGNSVAAVADAVILPRARSLADYAEVTERPLFNKSRRPEVSVKKLGTSSHAAQMSKQWKLTGVVMNVEHAYALFENQRDRKTLQLEKGMELAGWELENIVPDSATLASGSETLTFQLHITPDENRKP